MVNKALAGNVIEFKGISDRICLVAIRLNKKCQVNIIQVYAPTSSYDDEMVENFYSQVSTTIEMCKGNNTFVIGDFNGKVGQRITGETTLGKFGLGDRNGRGQMIVDFASRNELKVMNTFFQKSLHKKWTWKAPNGSVKNEIDYVMAKRPTTVTDVSVFTKANVGSDHRLVVGKVKIDTYHDKK